MAFTDEQLIEIVRMDNDGLSSRQIADIMCCGKSTIGDFLASRTYSDFWQKYNESPIASGSIEDPELSWSELKGRRFVFTSAQNNTFVHKKFLQSLEQYAEFNDAEVIVGTFTYNKNAYKGVDSQEVWYDPAIQRYIRDDDCLINDSLLWCGSLNILPTAVNPLSGFESYVKTRSGIIPHAKLQLSSLPSGKFESARMLYTTGTVTQRNYIEQKAGQKASFHHVYGALVVEIDDDGDWFARQLIAEDETGCFYDLNYRYEPDEVYEVEGHVAGVNWGDIHAEKLSPDAAYAGWLGEGNILDTLKPDYQFLHDVFDMHRRNHHNIKNPYHRYEMHCKGTESVRGELEGTTKVMEGMLRPFSALINVYSNHPAALGRWLNEADYKADPINAELFLELQLATYRAIKSGESDFDVFEYACKLVNPLMNDVRFMGEDESFMLAGQIECGQHGHNGNNGARGSVRSFRVLGKKHNKGHDHTASIFDGVWSAGACMTAEEAGYTKGGSTWSVSHILTYENGKRAMITCKGRKWRAL